MYPVVNLCCKAGRLNMKVSGVEDSLKAMAGTSVSDPSLMTSFLNPAQQKLPCRFY